MCQPRKWWIGLLPLLALWLLLNRAETNRIERELAGLADAALAQVAGEPGFSVAAGRDVSLNGWVFDEATRAAALAAAASAPGVRRVEDGLSEPPAENPYLWRASRDGDVVILSGATPSPDARASIAEAAREALPRARIIDQTSYFSGAPKNFPALAQAALLVLAHLSAGEAQLRDGQLSLSGHAANIEEHLAALAQARQLPDGMGLAKAELLPPETATFSFVAENDGKSLSLEGYIGSEAERSGLLAEARKLFPDLALNDQLKIFSGAPARSAVTAAYALRALAQLKSGAVTLQGDVASLAGQARAGMDALSVAEAIGVAPGMTLDAKAVTPGDAPADVMAAEKTETALILTGFYGDDDTHEKVLATAREKFAGLAVTDNMRRGARAPKAYLTAALDGLEQLARLHVGKFTLRDRAASLSGDAGRAELAEEVKTGFIAAMPEGYSVETGVTGAARETPPPAPAAVVAPVAAPDGQACQKKLTDVVRATPIRFDYRRAELKREASAVVEALAAAASQCPAVAFEVAGHSDDFIHDWRNLNLSRRRAEAVAAALVAAGIDPHRLTPVDRLSERAKNDGVEFNTK
ncbi:MAG: OmpA family protein [Rhodoblastus sp.]|uniref:OmpA family protein n=1 Tax=Rhodoblastus sp. TaxID=1962975 RepID=UPI003F9B29AE